MKVLVLLNLTLSTLPLTNFQAGGNGTVRKELSRLKKKKKSLHSLFSWKVPQEYAAKSRKIHMYAKYLLTSILNAPEASVNNTHPRSQFSAIQP